MTIRKPLTLLAMALALTACADPGATLIIEEAKASRLADGRVVIELEVLAKERLGGSLGTYCARVAFPGEPDLKECNDDLEDGDRKTLRYTSTGAARGWIQVDLLIADASARRTIAAP